MKPRQNNHSVLTLREKSLIRNESHCLHLGNTKQDLHFLLKYQGFLDGLKTVALLYQDRQFMSDWKIVGHCSEVWRAWADSQTECVCRKYDVGNTGTREDIFYQAMKWLGYEVVDTNPDIAWTYYNKERGRFIDPKTAA